MMSPEYIRSECQRAARKAARDGTRPMVLFSEDTAFADFRGGPFIGDHVPGGWKPLTWERIADTLSRKARCSETYAAGQYEGTVTLFCDSSGWCSRDEPALTIPEMQDTAKALVRWAAEHDVTLGVGVCEAGQFQAYVRVFEKEV